MTWRLVVVWFVMAYAAFMVVGLFSDSPGTIAIVWVALMAAWIGAILLAQMWMRAVPATPANIARARVVHRWLTNDGGWVSVAGTISAVKASQLDVASCDALWDELSPQLERHPRYAMPALGGRTMALCLRGRLREAIEVSRHPAVHACVEAQRRTARECVWLTLILTLRAGVLRDSGDLAAAESTLEEAQRLANAAPKLRNYVAFSAGWLHLYDGRQEEVKQRAIASPATEISWTLLLARCGEAQLALDRCPLGRIRSGGEKYVLAEARGLALLQLGRIEEAMASLEWIEHHGVAVGGTDVFIIEQLESRGERARAAAWLRGAIERNPEGVWAQKLRAMLADGVAAP